MNVKRATLQEFARECLRKLKVPAKRHGLDAWVEETIEKNEQGKCKATQDEAELLARCVNEDRVSRTQVPSLLGMSYRQAVETGVFDRIKKYDTGFKYSKVSVVCEGEEELEQYGRH